ncbi:MAG: PAS domain-containing protein [Bacteroidota bacterium]|nr:PAS domain-containing protein [Bacteroidota bacterium]
MLGKKGASPAHTSADYLRMILDHTNESFLVINSHLLIQNFNAKAEKGIWELFGKQLKTGESILNYSTRQSLDEAKAVFAEVLAGNQLNFDITYPANENNPESSYNITYTPITTQEGKVDTIVITSRNITEEKNFQKKLSEANERFAFAAKAAYGIVWDWNLDTDVCYFSEVCSEVLGYLENEYCCKTFWKEHIHPDEAERVIDKLKKVIENKDEFWEDEYRFIKANGEVAYIKDRGIILYDQSGKPYRMIGSMQDITNEHYQRLMLELESKIYELNLNTSKSLQDIIHFLLVELEKIHNGMYASVLTLQPNQTMQHFAAPSLPKDYLFQINGLSIGPSVGSCGSAMYHKEPVIVSDIQTDHRWELFKDLAEQFFLRACWSVPIMLNDNIVFGSLAFYYQKIKSPSEHELHTIQKLSHLIGILVSTRKATEANRISNERYEWVTKATQDLIWDWDLETDIIFRSKENLQQVYGLTDAEKLNTHESWMTYVHPDDKLNVEEQLVFALKDEVNNQFFVEYRFKRDDDHSYADIIDRCFIIRDKNKKPVRLVGAARNITERKKADGLLKASEERYRTLFLNNPLNIFVWDLETFKILDVNDKALETFGFTREAFLQKNVLELRPVSEHEKAKVTVQRLLNKTELKIEEVWEYSTLSGETVYLEVLKQRIDFEGRPAVLVLAENVTEKTRLSAKLEEERADKERQITEAMIQGQEKERYEVSQELHDNVNQLLTAARIYLESAKRKTEGSVNDLLSNSSNYILDAIEEIRKLSRSLVTPFLSDKTMKDAIKGLVADMTLDGSLKVEVTTDTFREEMLNDKFKLNLFRIIQEQLNNIIKHAAASRAIINLSMNEDFVSLQIEDNGVGFDTSIQRKGLGISNILRRANLYNGQAVITSSPGKGTAIKVKFNLLSSIS